MRTSLRPRDSAIARPRVVLPTPGGPTRHRIDPPMRFLSLQTARCSRMRSLTFSRPLWFLSRISRARFGASLSLLRLLQGRSSSHPAYVRITWYSALLVDTERSRLISRSVTSCAAFGMRACSRRSRSCSYSVSPDASSPSSVRIAFICCRRYCSRCRSSIWSRTSSCTSDSMEQRRSSSSSESASSSRRTSTSAATATSRLTASGRCRYAATRSANLPGPWMFKRRTPSRSSG